MRGRFTGEDRVHDVVEETVAGNYLTACSTFMDKAMTSIVSEDVSVDCPDCQAPVAQVLVAPSSMKPRTSLKPQWRTARNLHNETTQSLKFAHKAVVGAMEWHERGEPGQFLPQTLDQTHMAFRFLKEILVTHGRIDEDTEEYLD